MTNFRLVSSVTSEELASEWDALASRRHKQIISGADITFHHVMSPLVKGLVGEGFHGALVDIGSGTGELTKKLAPQFKRIICIEPSIQSLRISRKMLKAFSRVEYINAELEKTHLVGLESSTTFLASMVLSATADIRGFAKTLAAAAPSGSRFIATIPHPCFWPRYWGYESEEWFSYSKELFIQAPFKISLSRTSCCTTHVHRPIEAYIELFSSLGFRLIDMLEPLPSEEVQGFYPNKWEYPRFLGLKWIKAQE